MKGMHVIVLLVGCYVESAGMNNKKAYIRGLFMNYSEWQSEVLERVKNLKPGLYGEAVCDEN